MRRVAGFAVAASLAVLLLTGCGRSTEEIAADLSEKRQECARTLVNNGYEGWDAAARCIDHAGYHFRYVDRSAGGSSGGGDLSTFGWFMLFGGLAGAMVLIWGGEYVYERATGRRGPKAVLAQGGAQGVRPNSDSTGASRVSRRSTGAEWGSLTGVSGVGPTKQEALRKHFTSEARLLSASEDEIAEVTGVGPQLAYRIHRRLEEHPRTGTEAVLEQGPDHELAEEQPPPEDPPPQEDPYAHL